MNHEPNTDDPSVDLVLHTALGVVVLAMWAIAILTALSGLIVQVRMQERGPKSGTVPIRNG